MASWQRGWRGPRYSPPPYEYSKMRYSSTYGKPARPEPKPKRERVHIMIASQVNWCEYAGIDDGHAFSSKDPNKERIVRSKETDRTDSYGAKIVEDEEFFICGRHANGLFRKDPGKTAPQITDTIPD